MLSQEAAQARYVSESKKERLAMKSYCVILLLGFSSLFAQALEKDSKLFPIPSFADSIELHKTNIMWNKEELISGVCDSVKVGEWSEMISLNSKLYINADGPDGSGRYWTITIGVSDINESIPTGGTCMLTSTVGWRTLQKFQGGSLPWIEDTDNDGNAEILLWSSFPISDNPTMADYALIAWIYKLDSMLNLRLDHELTRKYALSIAQAYRSGLQKQNDLMSTKRELAADILEKYAQERD